MSFSQRLKVIQQRQGDEAKNRFSAFAIQLSNAIIKSTPVDTGRASGNWFPDINNTNTATSDTAKASDAISNVNTTGTEVKLGDTFTLTNNLPYINGLEYGNSKQAPQGMVRINVAKFVAAFRRKWG
jgi:hypothetical protein